MKKPDIGIGARLAISFSILILIAVFIGAVGWHSIEKVSKTIRNITSVVTPTVDASGNLIAAMADFNSIAKDVLTGADLKTVETLMLSSEKVARELTPPITALTALVKDKTLLSHIKTADGKKNTLLKNAGAMFDLHKSVIEKEAASKTIRSSFDSIGQDLDQRLDFLAEQSGEKMLDAEEEADTLDASGIATVSDVYRLLSKVFYQDYPQAEAALTLVSTIKALQVVSAGYLFEERVGNLEKIQAEFLSIYDFVDSPLALLEEKSASDGEKEAIRQIAGLFESLKTRLWGPETCLMSTGKNWNWQRKHTISKKYWGKPRQRLPAPSRPLQQRPRQ